MHEATRLGRALIQSTTGRAPVPWAVLRNLIYDRYWARQKNVEPTGFPAGIKMQGGESTIDDLVRSGKIAITQGGRSRPRRRGALLLRRALIGTRSERGVPAAV